MTLLTVRDLTVRFTTRYGVVPAVDGVSFQLQRGEILGLVGESGSGKSQILFALMGLLPDTATQSGEIDYRGKGLSIIFQDPLTALNPYLPIGLQIAEALPHGLGRAERRARVIAILKRLRIADPERRVDQYPHQLSGGMRQRVVIAMALIAEPALLLADEPTTALDVTVQADILDLLRAERDDQDRSLLLVTHDLGVVAGICDRVIVLYAGRIVEAAAVDALFANPRHPYTRALLAAIPRLDDPRETALTTIPGVPPDLTRTVQGCAFAPRCAEKIARCEAQAPALRALGPGHEAACHLADIAAAAP